MDAVNRKAGRRLHRAFMTLFTLVRTRVMIVSMSNTITLHAHDLDGYLSERDMKSLKTVSDLYEEYMRSCADQDTDRMVMLSSRIGTTLEEITCLENQIHVYSFETPREQHAEASRLIARLRNPATSHEEFLYYIQRAYELLFVHVYADKAMTTKRSIIQMTPVGDPCQNYAVHRIPDIDSLIHDSVMCVMLRGALLPSMIMSKEIQDYSSDGYITPFALFRIKRDESCTEDQMRYVLDLDKSFFRLVTIVKHLESEGVRPRSIKFINVISALKGSLRVARALPNAEIYTLWMDPVLNRKAYILPGLGDAGDRLNGVDTDQPRNIIQLIADYGQNIVNLYRNQVREIEKTVLP